MKKEKLGIKPRKGCKIERYHPPAGLLPDPDNKLDALLILPAGAALSETIPMHPDFPQDAVARSYGRVLPTKAGGVMQSPPFDRIIMDKNNNGSGKTSLAFAQIWGDLRQSVAEVRFGWEMFTQIGTSPVDCFTGFSTAFDNKAVKLCKKIKLK